MTADQLLNHELYHQAAQRDPRLNDMIRSALAENMTEAELGALVDRYIQAYDGVYDFSSMTAEQIAAICEEELFADLYAGIDNTGRQELRESAQRGFSEAQTMQPQNAEAERDTRGPPEGRFSINAEDGEYEVLRGPEGEITIRRLADGKTGDPTGNVYILANSIPLLENMDAVATVKGDEIPTTEKSGSNNILKYFDSIGNKVFRAGLGEVLLDKYGAKATAVKEHHPSRVKYMAIAAVPAVIQNGRLIHSEIRNGKQSYTFAAPADFLGKPVYVAAVVHEVVQDGKPTNKFYLDEIVDLNGYRFNIENKKAPMDPKYGATKGNGATETSTALSDNSIRSSSENSNPQKEGRASVEVGNDPEATVKEMLSRPMSKRDVKGIAYNEDLKKAFTSLTGIELPHYRRAEAEQKIMAYAASHYGMESETETDRKTGSQNRSGAGQSQNQRIRENGTQTLAELRREYKELRRKRDRYLRAVRRKRFREKAEQRRRLRKAAGNRQPILRRRRVGRCHGRRTEGADER